MGRRELRALGPRNADETDVAAAPVPAWIVTVHLAFLAWTVFNSHHVVPFLGGFLFFPGFVKTTAPHQEPVDLTSPVLVGFFLAGLVIHGGAVPTKIARITRRERLREGEAECCTGRAY